jgi:hypothetical protein
MQWYWIVVITVAGVQVVNFVIFCIIWYLYRKGRWIYTEDRAMELYMGITVGVIIAFYAPFYYISCAINRVKRRLGKKRGGTDD